MVVQENSLMPELNISQNTVNSDDTSQLPYPLWQTIVIAILIATFSIATILVNMIVLLAFYLDRTILKPKYYFIIALSVSDVMIGFFSAPVYGVYMLLGKWPPWLGDLTCDLWLSFDYTLFRMSNIIVFFITLDRYLSVKYPIKHIKLKTGWITIGLIAFSFCFPASYHFTITLGWKYLVVDNYQRNSMFCEVPYLKHISFIVFNICAFWIPLFIMVVLYVQIYTITRRLQERLDGKSTRIGTREIPTKVNQQKELEKTRKQFDPKCVLPEEGCQLSHTSHTNPLTTKFRLNTDIRPTLPNTDTLLGEYVPPFRKQLFPVSESSNRELVSRVDHTRKSKKNICWILGVYMVSFIPLHTVIMIEYFLDVDINEHLYVLMYWMAYLHSLVNTFAYTFSNETLNKSVMRVLKREWR